MIGVCKNCGNTIVSDTNLGREEDGSKNYDFCYDCYKNGYILDKDDIKDSQYDVFYTSIMPSNDGSIGNLSQGSNEIGASFLSFTVDK